MFLCICVTIKKATRLKYSGFVLLIIIKFTSLMILQLIHHPTDLSGFGLGFCLALACWAEAQRHRGVCDWTAQTGWAHRERRVLQLLLLVFKN